jgi:hypothetical protein
MPLAECKKAYMELSQKAFTPNNIIIRAVHAPGLGPSFQTGPLEEAIKEIIEKARSHLGVGADEALLREDNSACKV